PPVGGGGGGGTGTGGISLCTVGGITVNCAIKSQLTSLLNAARASGLVLSGGGYRDASSQIALRKAHCGTSYYAIYEMPASSCRPPTARPGTSQHEIGLAIDFSNCRYRSTACYQWLAGNAANHGFYNLPSEPWHWSTSGN
ncbi:MAG: mannose-binding lectin, partial [Acidimicrobiales bacterium]|nr:mannose-binding lectin [Acidimicrobiales bacterium]